MTSAAIRPNHRRAASAFMDALNGPFRRQQLAQAIYPHTTPRSRDRADQIAQSLMVEMARSGAIQRHAHLHWVKVATKRILRSGREVPELQGPVPPLSLDTRCPQKWAALDMETGEVMVGTAQGWRRATRAQQAEVAVCMGTASGRS
jgi:hypothetical protein